MIRKARGLVSAVAVVCVTALCMTGAVAQPEGAADVAVEVTGTIPGFADSNQLAGFLADQMGGAAPAWHFAAAPSGAPLPPNRVEWKFKTLKIVWGGGAHNGFPQPTESRSYVSAEARLYLNNIYQTTTLSQSTVIRGPKDADLAAMVSKVTKSLAAAGGGGTL